MVYFKVYLKYVMFIIVMILIILGIVSLFYIINIKYELDDFAVSIITISSTVFFGLSVAIFSYVEHLKQEREEQPKIFFDIAFDALINMSLGTSKYVVSTFTNTNIFVVVKNVGKNAIYNIKIELIGNINNWNKDNNRKVYLPSLLPGETKMFNTYITLQGIDMFDNAKVEVDFCDHNFIKQKPIIYDLIKNKEYLKNYLTTFTQDGDTTAGDFYKKVTKIRANESISDVK